jgi:hypothetical protein
MTALTTPARTKRDAGLRPVPWRRMAWVTWRQHRAALAGMAALLGAVAVYLGSPAFRCTTPRRPTATRQAHSRAA